MNWSDAVIQFQYDLGAPQELSWLVEGITYFVGALILATASLTLALLLIWITRKVISRIQDRIGPNRLGPYGLFQTVADAMKLLSKEDIKPTSSDTVSYAIAPVLAVLGVLMSLAVIPFGAGLIGADLSVGVLYLVALGSIGIMAALMAGWGSNNKYALLAGFRVVAQLLSYEIPMVLAMLAPVLLVGTMSMQGLANAQSLYLGPINLGLGWFIFVLPGAFLIYMIAALAESEQTPFDLLEAESELIAGFHIEYSGMKFAMFFLAQFLNSFFLGAIAVSLFLGGWQGPFVDQGHLPTRPRRSDDAVCLESVGAVGVDAALGADDHHEVAAAHVAQRHFRARGKYCCCGRGAQRVGQLLQARTGAVEACIRANVVDRHDAAGPPVFG
jgi:NADH-quinone oxidoreductase subunit H